MNQAPAVILNIQRQPGANVIEVVDHIARYIEQGDAPLEAALKGSRQIGFTILSLTVSLVAVLIPLLFMADVVGRLFREFAVTLGITIIISAVVSLTLTPMMCATLLRYTPPERQGRFYRWSERVFATIIARYGASLTCAARHLRARQQRRAAGGGAARHDDAGGGGHGAAGHHAAGPVSSGDALVQPRAGR